MASQHQKERCCSLALRLGLGLELRSLSSLDTDRLGTFCGEVERPGPPGQVVLQKARLALTGRRSGDLALASEASFGPHPACPWVAGHQEILALVDGRTGHCWVESLTTHETNFAQEILHSQTCLDSFLQRVGFPKHAVMERQAQGGWRKGLTRREDLSGRFPTEVATDMRAHLNPLRRRALRKLSLILVKRMRTLCPDCQSPGFGVTEQQRGLPCELCSCPTAWIDRELWSCFWCGLGDLRPRSDGLRKAPAAHCDRCNP